MILLTTIKDLRHLTIEKLPAGRVVNMAKAIRCDDVVIFVGKNGNLYHNGRAGNYAYMPDNWPWRGGLVKALLKLKVISKEQHDEHVAYVDSRTERRNNKYIVAELTDYAKKAGIKLTQGQINKLNRLPV